MKPLPAIVTIVSPAPAGTLAGVSALICAISPSAVVAHEAGLFQRAVWGQK